MNTLQLQLLMWILAGWVNRSQQDVIEYLQEENRVLREQLGGKRLRLTDGQRRRLAAKAKAIGRRGLFEIGTLVAPETLLRWYRRLIAKKYDGSRARKAGHGRHLREAVKEYTEHYHFERNHQGLNNQLIEKMSDAPNTDGAVACRERLGGVLTYYYRRAA